VPDRSANKSSWSRRLAAPVAAVVLIGTGFAQRALTNWRDELMNLEVQLVRPLSELPAVLGDWLVADDELLPDDVVRVAGLDQHVLRSYRNRLTGRLVQLYVGYSGRINAMRGHSPQVCYAAHGWTRQWSQTEPLEVDGMNSSQPFTVNVEQFERLDPLGRQRDLVVSYYICDGQYSNEAWQVFRHGPGVPRTRGGKYLAAVQVISRELRPAEGAVRDLKEFVALMGGYIEASLP